MTFGMRTRLSDYIEKAGITQAEFARQSDLDPEMVSLYARAQRRPGLASALAIDKATGGAVPASYWTTVLVPDAHGRRRRTVRRVSSGRSE